MEPFTVEEVNLMCIYNTRTRTGLLFELRASLPFAGEPELRAQMESVAARLEAMTDAEFQSLALVPDYEETEDDHAD